MVRKAHYIYTCICDCLKAQVLWLLLKFSNGNSFIVAFSSDLMRLRIKQLSGYSKLIMLIIVLYWHWHFSFIRVTCDFSECGVVTFALKITWLVTWLDFHFACSLTRSVRANEWESKKASKQVKWKWKFINGDEYMRGLFGEKNSLQNICAIVQNSTLVLLLDCNITHLFWAIEQNENEKL